MSAPSIYFDPPFDIHLLRGQSLQIVNELLPYSSLLQIGGIAAHTYVDNNAGISYKFCTSFAEGKAADFGITLDNPVGNKPAFVHKPDWRITLVDIEPAVEHNRIRNFYLYARVEDGTPDPSPWTALRIHIHNGLEQVWITPYALTITPGVTYQTRLYGRFDDDVVAEISDQSDYSTTRGPDITWNSPTPDLIIPATGSIRAENIVGIHDITVEVVFNGIPLQDSGIIIISRDLTADSTLRAELVATGGCPGFPRLADVPNILFLSEGFTQDQEFNFKILAAEYVLDLMTKKITSPFNLLKGSINFWMVFVPSRESGATYRGQLAVRQKPNEPILPKLLGESIPFIENSETKPVSDWDVEHLIYWVGLPTRAEQDSTDQGVLDRLFAKWAATTKLSAENIAKLKTRKSLRKEWQKLAERRLPDGKDTAFGVIINDYTAALESADFNIIDLDRKRIQRSDLDAFLSTLKDEDNNLIGPTFIQAVSLAQPQGKDFDNIILLTAVRRGRSKNSDGYLFSTVDQQDTETLIGDLTTLRVPIAPTDMPGKLPIRNKKTITHELCHSFGLGDEYGEKPTPYTGPLIDIDEYSNIQARKSFERPRKDGQPGTEIDAYKIKWRYHRIQKCSLVTAITTLGNDIVITLKNPEVAFKVNETVFFRKRRANSFQLRAFDEKSTGWADIVNPAILPKEFTENYADILAINGDKITVEVDNTTLVLEMKAGQASFFDYQPRPRLDIRQGRVTDPIYTLLRTPEIPATPATPAIPAKETLLLSPEMTVKSVAGNQVTLQAMGAAPPNDLTTLNPGEEILLYAAIAAPGNQQTNQYRYAELIAKPILDYLDANAYPLNANSAHEEIIDTDIVQNSSLPGRLIPCCSRREKEIIGLYSGGKAHHFGVYHSTAQCMMLHGIEDEHYIELCAVCRYTLINQIDPTKHTDFDTDYMKRKIYPD